MKAHTERAFTLIELMIVVAIIALLAAIAIPNVLRARTSANEAATIGNDRAIISSLEMARSVNNVYPLDLAANTWQLVMYGANCLPTTLPVPDFGPTPFCGAMTAAAPMVVQGYQYSYAAGTTAGQQYTLMAEPTNAGNTGSRAFFTSETAQLRHCRCAATGVPPACAATVANALVPAAGWVTIDTALPVANCS